MRTLKIAVLAALTFLALPTTVRATDSCQALFDDLAAWTKTPTSDGINVVSYHMTLMYYNRFAGYGYGALRYSGDSIGPSLYTNYATMLFSDRLVPPKCSPGMICIPVQPFDYNRPDTLSFEIRGPSILWVYGTTEKKQQPGFLYLHLPTWYENHTMALTCQKGYMYGSDGTVGVMLYPWKDKRPSPPK